MTHTITLDNKAIYRLKPLEREEVDEARLLCDECVGKNLYSEEEIVAALHDTDKFFYLLKSEEDETIGYIYYYLTEVEYIAKCSKLDVEVFSVVYAAKNKKVGKIQSVGLKAEYRGIGLATQMIQVILKELKRISVDIAFIVCWKPGGIVPLAKVLEECEFRFLTEAKKVWYDDAELICPYCKGRCLCDAEVYYKLLDGGRNDETETFA